MLGVYTRLHTHARTYVCVFVYCRTLESVESLVMLDRVNKLVGSDIGVWVSYRSSSHISLYDTQHFVVLLSLDYCILLPPQQVQSDKVGSI